MAALVTAVRKTPSIRVVGGYVAETLTVDGEGKVNGILVRPRKGGRVERVPAGAVVLAVGGIGHLYEVTTNPPESEGSGIGMAARAGAVVADPEFVQFHPTALAVGRDPAPLLTEALRGEGATLINAAGERFMLKTHPLAELAPRDIVARAIVAEMRSTAADHVLLDCTGLKSIDLAARFPGIFAFCKSVGIDMREQPIPVAPAAHYLMGGIRTDVHGRTTLPGLYACGEVACTGVHGANRLASNSLMETVVFGKRVVEALAAEDQTPPPAAEDVSRLSLSGGRMGSKKELQRTMWECAGIEREARGLERALGGLQGEDTEQSSPLRSREAWECAQMHTVARLMLEAALRRTESRGAHYRSDFPARDERRWQRRQVFRRAD
jgi:L-aspartate oxidase